MNKTKKGKGFRVAGTVFLIIGVLNTISTIFRGEVTTYTLLESVSCFLVGAMFYFFGWLKIKAGKGFVIAGMSIIVFACIGLLNNIYYNGANIVGQIIIVAILFGIPGAILIFIGYSKFKKSKNNLQNANTVQNVPNVQNTNTMQDNQPVQTKINGFCSKCGKPLNSDPFCSGCGSPVNK